MIAGLEALYTLGVGTGVNQVISSHDNDNTTPALPKYVLM